MRRARVTLHPCYLGWREWAALPELSIRKIKVKIDTGARTSALHVVDMEILENKKGLQVAFTVPDCLLSPTKARITLPVRDKRDIKNSGGNIEHRVVIHTTVIMGETMWPIELTLTDRAGMKFPMLLGRMGIPHGVVVNPYLSFVQGEAKRSHPQGDDV